MGLKRKFGLFWILFDKFAWLVAIIWILITNKYDGSRKFNFNDRNNIRHFKGIEREPYYNVSVF